ncbi:MAG: 3-isopropylmalate dehydrogenase [Acidobacteria bacterium]|nr:3-isopropylmalate dehydrogenase [Acidobacteriota bacterium]
MAAGTTRRVLLLPGDGIGPEVVREAAAVLRDAAAHARIKLEMDERAVGGAALVESDEPLPKETLDAARRADAVLLGAVGLPEHDALPQERRPERALLGLRKGLGTFANLRPVKLYPVLEAASPLRSERVRGTDLLIVRELTGGIYFGVPRGVEGKAPNRVARNTLVYSEMEIRRIARVAFEAARKRRKRVTSVDKANILETSQLWREVVGETAKEYADVRLEHLLVDNAAMQLLARPAEFDVILTGNMFGDILSDEAAMLAGGIGMLPSASLGESSGLYEPVHGSAPDIAGRGAANPLAAILSVAMLLRHSLEAGPEAERIEKAVEKVLAEGARTPDIGREGERTVTTAEMGERVREAMARAA